MRSRKSILNKGIVFVMSVFAFMIFSFTKINAACEVSFNDGNPYLTLAGDVSKWNDTGLTFSDCDNFEIKSLTINGEEVQSTSFIPGNVSAGHYTIGYNYVYNDGTKGVIYRYVRVLNSNLETSNNYSAVTFDFDDTSSTSVIDSFLVGDYYFANFIVHGNSTYVVIKDSLGKQATGGVVELQDPTKSFAAKKVIKNGNNYYIIGNNVEGNGILVGYQITVEKDSETKEISATVSQLAGVNYTSAKSIYNGAYLDGTTLYIAGQSSDGYPIIDKYEGGSTNSFYKHTVLGAYNGVLSSNGTVYAVGYTKASSTISSGLYTYISVGEDPVHHTIISDAETVFNDIVMYNNQNIIVGKSEVNSINANNVLAATNTRQGFSDGIILRVSSDGQTITGAHMLGGNVNDEFTSIKLISGSEYIVTGKMNDEVSSLVYKLDASSFEVTMDVTSGKDTYKINGITSWDYGYAYYGEISSNSILGLYYPLNGTNYADALFVSLDSRGFEDYETLPFITSETEEHKYCDYPIKFGLENKDSYNSIECNTDESALISVSTIGTSSMTYQIDAKTGVTIYVYRVIKITKDPDPIDLNSDTSTGILKWYTYNRTSTNVSTSRVATTDFNYIFNGNHSDETIEDMIKYYMENGNSNGYELQYIDDEDQTHKTFTKSNQTSAAFATIEYAKMFAYYQEFSRIVKMDGSVAYDDLGAEKYPTEIIYGNTPYYIYYIDYKGANAGNQVISCSVSKTSIGNCSAKGGYAFASLNSIKKIIEDLLVYNNFFVNTRNTIYNGSIAASEIDAYKQSLTTKEYVKSLGFSNNKTQLTFNVKNENGTVTYYSGTGKNVYFGGKLAEDGKTMTHSLISGNQTVSAVSVEGITYYESSSSIFFTHNACYTVTYSNNNGEEGNPRYFCLDTMAPTIEYKKESSDSVTTQVYPAIKGSEAGQPLYIESDFTITDLIDLDDYAFIYVNGNRYPIECGNYNSKTCLEDVEKYIKQSFRYDSKNPTKVQTIEFSDRLSNKNTFYFVIGTLAPSVSVENETDDGFTLIIDFYQTNPITVFQASVSYQSCEGKDGSSVNCYIPVEGDEMLDINYDLDEFNTAVTNYIYAVNYRDNLGDVDQFEIISAQEGIYTINGIDYVIEEGNFVEYKGYEESYSINSNNIFEYNKKTYVYNALSKSIQSVTLNEDNEYVSDGSESITLMDNTFKFENKERLYTIVDEDGKLSVKALPQSYQIDNENKFKIGDVEYTIDFEKETLTFANPELTNMKRITLEFFRTTKGNEEQTGVRIPKTQLITNQKGETVKDASTGFDAYEILEEEWHFNVVDGVYTFVISHYFAPGIDRVETKINVEPLEFNAGFVSYIDGLVVENGKVVEYDTTYDESRTGTTLFVTSLVDQFRYPLSADIVSSSNLSTYENTHFLNKTVYFSYPTLVSNDHTVLIIRVYDKKNAYGLPSTDNATSCTEVVIYGNAYSKDDHPSTSLLCSASHIIYYSQISDDLGTLENLGINKLTFTTGAFFALNGENVFYDVYLKSYEKDNDGIYQPSAVTANKSFYLDSKSPDEDTVNAYVYDNSDGKEDSEVKFTLDEGIYRLNERLGSTRNVAFDINWYTSGSNVDYKENKLLLMSIYDGNSSVTCNLFQLINNPNYSTDCRNYIDVDGSYSTNSEFRVVFSATGNYEITFTDASGNGVTYEFVIDKTAPDVILTGASMEIDGNDMLVIYEYKENYYLKSYVKNVKFEFTIEDLGEITSYCYYFDYGQADKETICPTFTDSRITIIMNDYYDIKTYLETNGIDQNITLVIWAYDAEGNSNESNPTKVLFWVDYKKPEVSYTYTNLNRDTVGNVAASHLAETTIAIATGDYSGKNIICDSENGFSFVDYRYVNTSAPYTFVLKCSDLHTAGKDEYPNTYGFDNTMYVRFYEWDGSKKGDVFNFGIPTQDGFARWIYITVEDVVGNESDDYVVLPISILDIVNPAVVKAEKEVEGSREIIQSVTYSYNNDKSSSVYLANSKIYITFSESIAMVVSCKTIIGNNDRIIYEGSCSEYSDGQKFEYSSLQLEFAFDNDESDTYKLIVFEVSDFATLSSGEVVVVIDKLAPVIDFNEGGEEDDTIEYITQTNKKYDLNYASGGYNTHINVSDDQKTSLNVTVLYTQYSPTITYNNYIYNATTKKYESVANGSPRESGKKYYLLIESSSLINKKCVADEIKGEKAYCFVEDTQSFYYFDSLLTDESGKVWKDVNAIDSSAIGVYRVAYFVTDYAGNVSNTIYKKVFVNDTVNPDLDIYTGDGNSRLYSSVTSNNPNNFEGKLNQLVEFHGTDSAKGENTRIVLYRCAVDNYTLGKCNINQNLFSRDTNENLGKGESTSNIYGVGTKLTNGVYKAFVYDMGSYISLESSSIYYDSGTNETGKVYSLTHNTSHVYFAVNIDTITANYTIYGNKYIDHTDDNFQFVYSDTNYYKITNSNISQDVYLVRYLNGSYVNVSNINSMIGYSGNKVEFTLDGNIVTVTYKDSRERIIYQIKYEEYQQTPEMGLLLHETYHKINLEDKTSSVCRIVNGENECNDLSIVYKVISVEAYIYPDGEYILQMRDRYGNYSQEVEALVVDNSAYTVNKDATKATGVNYWFSVPSKVVNDSNVSYFAILKDLSDRNDINVLDAIYNNNFNSNFFYAFASKEDAKRYLIDIYSREIDSQLSSKGSFDFYYIDGSHYQYSGDVNTVLGNITSAISNMIFTTYTPTTNFSNDSIKQVAYEGNEEVKLSSSMYKYAYLLVTKSVTNNEIINTYEYKGSSCETGDDNKECIKVNLNIVNTNNNFSYLKIDDNDLVKLTCKMSGTFGSDTLTDGACRDQTVASGATYLFIEVEENKYHRNVVYYGITAYTETTKIEYAELGDYIPLSEFTRYSQEGNDYVEDESGEYIWLDSKFVSLASIRNTNLLIEATNACTFNGDSYNECIFVTYLGRYHRGGDGKYNPSSSGEYYYNYYTKTYGFKSDVMEQLGVDSTYSNNGNRSEDQNGENVPVKITISDDISVGFDSRLNKQTNKKMYIELFNSDNSSVDTTIFEINAIKVDGVYNEVYSYATLIINNVYYNINQYITFDGDSYKCVIDIDINSRYEIKVIDRAGNTLNLNFSHSNYVPDITYTKQSESTASNVTVDIETKSIVSSISKNYVKVYKYTSDGLGNFEFTEYENVNSACVFYLTDIDASYFVQKLTMEFRYNQYLNCSGVYRIQVQDNHNNTRFKDIIFNPYNIETSYQLDSINNIYEYNESEIDGVIVNKQIRVDVDSSLYYLVINQYAPYTNLNLSEPLTLTLKSFVKDEVIGSCKVVVSKLTGSVYSIYINGETDHSCDGIYTIDLINKFSENVLDLGLTHLDGANTEIIQSRVTYNSSNTIELDTTAPNGDMIGEEVYFDVLVDEMTSNVDTLELINFGSISYKNKYISIHWGGAQEHSLAYLKYRVKNIEDNDTQWAFHTSGVNYSGAYNAQYEFKYTESGVYICEFMFTDALGNENANKIYQIVITIEAPNVGFFEVNDNPNVVGRQYAQFDSDGQRITERIADRTILKCLVEVGSAYTPQNCNENEYNYVMQVNGVEYSFFIDFLNSIITIDSLWLKNAYLDNRNVELNIHLTVSVKDKPAIKTELFIVIDKKAPDITLSGFVIGSTYTGSVKVGIKSDDDRDPSNSAVIYKCDVVNYEPLNNMSECLVYDNKQLVESDKVAAVLENNTTSVTIGNENSGYFMVIASDAFGNQSSKWFTLDNQAPTISIISNDIPVAPNMYSNANSVFVEVNDTLSKEGSSFEIEFIPLNSADSSEIIYNPVTGLSKEGKYTLTPKDGVGIVGRSVSFYIYRQTPGAMAIINDDIIGSALEALAEELNAYLNGDSNSAGHRVGEKVYFVWGISNAPEKAENPDLYAPIVSATIDGKIYDATYDKEVGGYVGKTITDIGEHTFVLTDAAGNRKVIMVTINNTSKVCINGKVVEVKMQAYYDIDNLMIGHEEGITYEKDDVIIFALPSGGSSDECMQNELLGYRTLDKENSNYLIDSDKNAELFNKYQYNFVEYGFISDKAIKEIKNVGGTVVVFVVTKDIANNELGYSVGTNFFMEDPVGWTMIFVSLLGLVWPACRIFIKKKVRII